VLCSLAGILQAGKKSFITLTPGGKAAVELKKYQLLLEI
jgi:hypothetical protein